MLLPPKPPRRSKKVQVFLTEGDYDALRRHAELSSEKLGAFASRALSRFAEEIRRSEESDGAADAL